MKMKGAKILLESLKKEGVKVIFGYPGGKVLDIYDELYREKAIRHILVRHEQGAAHAADGYARTTGKVGVCLATSGPGATNLVTGIATAHMDSIPMVAITGQVATTQIGTDAFQEADVAGITLPITKHNYIVKDISQLAYTVKEAFHLARTGRPGPVLIDIPVDISAGECEFKYPEKVNMPNYRPTIKGNPKQIKEAAKMIAGAQRPLILAGGGILAAQASKELADFINYTNIPVSTTLMAMGTIASANPLNLGMPGMHGTATANYAICEADLLIAIGMRFDDRITGKLSEFAKQAKIIHIDIDPAEINKCIPATLPIIGDAREIIKELFIEIKKGTLPDLKKWHKQLKEWQASHPLHYDNKGKKIKPQMVIETINKLVKGEAVFTTDVGAHQMWAAQFIEFKRAGAFATSGGLGTMGYGVPAAIGAQVGNPKDLVICFSGDGSFQMNLQELGTIATNNLPIKILIMNNHYLGMVRQWQEFFYGERYSHTDLNECQPDFVKLAEAYGILGLRIEETADVEKILKKALNHQGPVLIDIHIEREENVFPMVPPGGVLNKMLLHPGLTKQPGK